MFEERGVRQQPDVDGCIRIVCRCKDGSVVRSVTLSASVPEEWVAWEVRKAEAWLNRYDPPMRVVAGGLPPQPRLVDPPI